MGGTSIDYGYSITTDDSGCVYTTGSFKKTGDFDPGAGVTNLTSVGITDIYIQKLNTNGNFIWAKSMGGTSSDYGYSITTDDSGCVYTTGRFKNTVDFDPGAGVTNLTSVGNTDIYIQKLDANGKLIWVRSMGGTDNDQGRSITIDGSGNVYTTGRFKNTVDFDPGAALTNLSSAGIYDIYIQKLCQSSGVGIGENRQLNITQVFPNPTNGVFSIEFNAPQEMIELKLLDASGKLIDNKTYYHDDVIVYELNQPQGIYFIELSNQNNLHSIVRLIRQ